MSREIWRKIQGFKYYEASNLGRIRSLDRPIVLSNKFGSKWIRLFKKRILAPHKCSNGYVDTILCDGKRKRRERIHVLVLETFSGPRPKGFWAAHLNGIRDDNRLSNLKWVSRKENNRDHKYLHGTILHGERHQNSKLTDAQVTEIKKMFENKKPWFPPYHKDAAKKYGVARETISGIVSGKRRIDVKEVLEALAQKSPSHHRR